MQHYQEKTKARDHRTGGVVLIAALIIVGMWSPVSKGEAARTIRQTGAESKTAWEGVYTEAQARAGQVVFEANCDGCHGDTARGGGREGTRLNEPVFFENWREDTVGSLYTKVRSTMPRREAPLSDPEYLVAVAYLLEKLGFPAGDVELNPTSAGDIRIEGKDGPKPLPPNSLVQAVGCLTLAEGDQWTLTRVSNPSRNRNSDPERESTPEEVDTSRNIAMGDLTFDLANFFMLGDFDPAAHEGHRMLARGALISRPSGDRISLTNLDMLSPRCDGQ